VLRAHGEIELGLRPLRMEADWIPRHAGINTSTAYALLSRGLMP
jgi:hypothetical protein